jgi:hypothetical protein
MDEPAVHKGNLDLISLHVARIGGPSLYERAMVNPQTLEEFLSHYVPSEIGDRMRRKMAERA